MIRRPNQIFYTLILLIILTSCTTAPTQTLSVNFTVTSKPTIIIPTNESTNTPLPPTSTPEIETVIVEESTSLDGIWTAMISLTTQERDKKLDFRVSNKSTNKEWIVEQLEWNELQTPSSWVPFPYIFKWSKDNDYLYYSYEPNFNDGCFGIFKPGGLKLDRLDLTTGEIVAILDGGGTWMSLSPNEKQLAYIKSFGGNVSILDIENGKTQNYPLPPIENKMQYTTDTSDLYWSPDGKSLIYAHYIGACDLMIPYSYIFQLFPDTGQQKVLVDHSEQGYIPDEWTVQDKVLLRDTNGDRFLLDVTTKEITRINQ